MSLGLMIFACALSVASCSISHILVKSASEYATTIDNFASILKVAFNRSSCCNVLISGKHGGKVELGELTNIVGESTTTKNMLKEFVRVYSQTYTLNGRTYDCGAYLMISTSVNGLIDEMESVPTAKPDTELLILIDKIVNESTKLFNVSLYDVAKVNIVTPDALWTLDNHFLVPAVFKKVASYHEIIDERKTMNLQGLELIAASMYKPPFCYLQSTEIRTVKGIEGEYYIVKNESEVDGIEMKLFMLMAERLNFTWSIRSVKEGERIGGASEIGTTQRMIGKIIRKEVDIAFTNFWLVLDTYLLVNVTTPWGTSTVSFLVPRPRPLSSFWALTRPLSPAVWAAFIAMLILQSIYVCTKAWLTPKVSKRFRNLFITLTELIGILVGHYHPTRLQGLQLQLKLWSFIGTLLVTAYSSSLADTLANSRYEKRIDTAKDFIEANLSWGNELDSEASLRLMFDSSDPYVSQFHEHYEHENSDADRHRKILQGNYAIVGETVFSSFFPDENVTNEDLKTLCNKRIGLKGFRLMKHHITSFPSSFAVQSWLLESMDMVILRMQEVGLVQYHVKDVLQRRTSEALREVLIEHDGPVFGPKTLHLMPLGSGFMALFVGLLISTIVFYFELRSASNKTSIRQVLLEIKNIRLTSPPKPLKRKRSRIEIVNLVTMHTEPIFLSEES